MRDEEEEFVFLIPACIQRIGAGTIYGNDEVASVLITACSIAKANIWEVSKANLPFVGVLLFVLFLCTYVPAVPMFLVEYFYR